MKSKAKIALVIQHGKVGGIEQHVLTLAKGLKLLGIDPLVVMLFGGGPMTELFERSQIPYTVLDGKNGHDWRLAFRLLRVLHRENPAVVHMHAGTIIGALVMLMVPKMPLIVTEHMTKSGRNIPIRTKIIWALLHRRAEKIIAVCESTRQGLLSFNRALASKIQTIYNGVDLNPQNEISHDSFDRNKIFPTAKFLIGAVGRLSQGKGWHEFIEVADIVASKVANCEFVVIGDGPLRQELEENISRLGSSSKVHFLGFRSDVRSIVSSLDLYLLLSEHEACPLTFIEALAEKTPVTGFLPVGGVKEINVGISPLFEERSIDILAAKIISMLNEKFLMKLAAEKAYTRVTECCDSKDMCQKVMDIYRRVIK